VPDDPTKVFLRLSKVCELYWFPIYAFYRDDSKNHHDAQDLAQGFFKDLLERGDLTQFDVENGNFRAFLRKAARNFAMNKSKENRAQKRGSGKTPITIDKVANKLYKRDKLGGETPENNYDRRWARALIDGVLDQLKEEFVKKKKEGEFTLLAPFMEPNFREVPMAKLAKALDISEPNVKVRIHRMRKRWGTLLRAKIADTVGSMNDVDEEICYLYDLLGGKADEFFKAE